MTNVLEVKALNKVYPGTVHTQALSDIHLSVEVVNLSALWGRLGAVKQHCSTWSPLSTIPLLER